MFEVTVRNLYVKMVRTQGVIRIYRNVQTTEDREEIPFCCLQISFNQL